MSRVREALGKTPGIDYLPLNAAVGTVDVFTDRYELDLRRLAADLRDAGASDKMLAQQGEAERLLLTAARPDFPMVLGLRGGNRFSKRTLVGTLRNARDAPLTDLRDRGTAASNRQRVSFDPGKTIIRLDRSSKAAVAGPDLFR